ncbi:phosphate ABC transporter permease [Oscillatoriales cyanobacterium USR001]|nr:phosphate ABC transporter permease [Oscillatoriales cyanobacterium USR001]
MLVPLTRQTFEELIPAVATGAQYKYAWGKPSDFLKRLLISVVIVLLLILVYKLAWEDGGQVVLILGLVAGLYWLWGPVLSASLRNIQCRKYKYSGFWQGRVLDVYITEDVITQEETVNKKGELVIVDNLERMINVEVGDKTGFTTQLKAPINRSHQEIVPGQVALMIVMSNEEDLSRIAKASDIYIPSRNIWVSDYPYLRRDVFIEVSNQLKRKRGKKGVDGGEERRSERMRSRVDY